MIVAGIDPSLTSAGVAVLADGRVRKLIAVGRTGNSSEGYEDRSDRIDAQSQLVVSHVPLGAGLVVIEGPAYDASWGSAFDRHALWHFIYRRLRLRRARIAVVPPASLKKFATGNGNAPKGEVRDAARETWPDAPIRTSDQADALWAAAMGAAHVGDWLPFDLSPQQLTTLQPLVWGPHPPRRRRNTDD